jgi:hypothetical protein
MCDVCNCKGRVVVDGDKIPFKKILYGEIFADDELIPGPFYAAGGIFV